MAAIIRKKKFDLESCYLTKSPCRNCSLKNQLPKCSDNCRTLAQIQELMAGTISCFSNFSEDETYSLSRIDF
jgi:hypothetical protein